LSDREKVLVVGLGNPLMGDDGVGICVVRELEKFSLPDHVELMDGGNAGPGLVDILSRHRKVIAIDAIRGAGSGRQEIRLLSPDDLVQREDGGGYSVHDLGLAFALRLLDLLGMEIPDITIIGIPAVDISPEIGLSEECSRLVPEAVDLVMRIVRGEVHWPCNDTAVIVK